MEIERSEFLCKLTATFRPVYCATGRFALQATRDHGLSGRFDGRLAVDFQLNGRGRAQLVDYTTNVPLPATGPGLRRGVARCGAANDSVPAVWKQGMAVAHQVLRRFQIGDPDAHLNPRYPRVSWNTCWQNDEWWAETQTAKR